VTDALTLNIRLVSAANVSADIYSFTGQKVFSESLSLNSGANTVNLDMSRLSPGFYMLKILSAEGIKIVQKIIKQ